MPSVDELLELAEADRNINDVFTIDPNSREITVPSSESIFGVEEDKDSERKYFKCPKIVGDNVDLSSLRCKINYINANGEKGQYLVEDVTTSGDYIEFSWLISEKVCEYKGNITFLVVFEKALSSTEFEKVWHTTIATGEVIVGIKGVGEEISSKHPDIIEQILLRLDNGAGGSGGGMTQAERNQLNKNTEDVSSLFEDIANLKEEDSRLKEDLNDLKGQIGQGGGNGGSGLNSTAKTLLISILRNAIYETDQSAVINALETALSTGGSDNPDIPDVPDEPDKTYYDVLVTANGCTVQSSATRIEQGGVYVGNINVNDGFEIDSVVVTMGGVDVSSSVYSDGTISINNVTGNVVIVASASKAPKDVVKTAIWSYGKRQYSATALQDNESFTSVMKDDAIEVTPGQILHVELTDHFYVEQTMYTMNTANVSWSMFFANDGKTSTVPSVNTDGNNTSNYMKVDGNGYPKAQDIVVPDGAKWFYGALASLVTCSVGEVYDVKNSVKLSCESLDGSPRWFKIVLKDGE